MAALAITVSNTIELVLAQLGGRGSPSASVRSGLSASVCYAAFALTWIVVWLRHSDRDFSAVLTLAAGVQCLGFAILYLKVFASKTVEGMSAKSLQLFVVFFVSRLTSTLFKNGYIPVDRSGDWAYQAFDVCSLVLTLHLLYCTHQKYRHTYQDEHDTFPILQFIPPCALLAYNFHANVNHSPFFDQVWAFSLYMETFVLVPQLFLVMKLGGAVDMCTAHFVVCTVVSRMFALLFWWYGHLELAAFEGGSHIPGRLILGSYLLQLLSCADFVYLYVKAMVAGRQMIIPDRIIEL